MNEFKRVKMLFSVIASSSLWISCKKEVAAAPKPLKIQVTQVLQQDV